MSGNANYRFLNTLKVYFWFAVQNILIFILAFLVGLSSVQAGAMSNAGYMVNRLLAVQGGAIISNASFSAPSVLGGSNEAGAIANPSYKARGGFISLQAPTGISLSLSSNQTINEDTPTSAISLTISGSTTAPSNWVLTATSSNTALLPVANIVLGGSGATRTVPLRQPQINLALLL